MLKREVSIGTNARVVLVDSITQIEPSDAGAIVVTGSHGGASAGEVASSVELAAVFFNDAGVGKDDAGVAALAALDAREVPAFAVAHVSARIGDADDTWQNGVVSRVNASAARLGHRAGDRVRDAVMKLSESRPAPDVRFRRTSA